MRDLEAAKEIYRMVEGMSSSPGNALDEVLGAIDETIDKNSNAPQTRLREFLKDLATVEFGRRLGTTLDSGLGYDRQDSLTTHHKAKKFLDSKPTYEKIAEEYLKYKQLFKNEHANPEGFDIFSAEDVEEIVDAHAKIIRRSQVRQYARRFLRSYMHLMNERSYEIFDVILDKEFKPDFVSKELRKVAKFDSSETLNSVLQKISQMDALTREKILQKMEDEGMDSEVVYDNEGVLAVMIDNYEDSERLGSGQWCISTDESMFDEYVHDRVSESLSFGEYPDSDGNEFETASEPSVKNKNIFIWNFNKPESDSKFLIGVTLAANGEVVVSHDKNDDDITDNYLFWISKDIHNEIVKNTFPFHKGELNVALQELPKYKLNDVFEEPDFLVMNTTNPLNIFRYVFELDPGRIDKVIEGEYGLKVDDLLLAKSIDDYINYSQIAAPEMIEDLFWFSEFIEKYKPNVDALEDLEDEYGNSYNFASDINATIHPSSDEIINHKFAKIVEDLSKIQKDVLFKKHRKAILGEINRALVNDEHRGSFLGGRLDDEILGVSMDVSLLVPFKDQVLQADTIFGVKSTDQLVRDFVTYSITCKERNYELSENELESLKVCLVEGRIHPNKYLCKLNSLSTPVIETLLSAINEKPEILTGGICFDLLNDICASKNFVEKLSDEACGSLNKAIRCTHHNGRYDDKLYSTGERDLYFPEHARIAYERGIVDDEILSQHMNGLGSGVCMGTQSRLSEMGYGGADGLINFIKSKAAPTNEDRVVLGR